MISPDAAFFVPVLVDRNTGEREYRAYRLKPDANAAATELGSAPTDWTTVLETAVDVGGPHSAAAIWKDTCRNFPTVTRSPRQWPNRAMLN
jgi:hypothetical protein